MVASIVSTRNGRDRLTLACALPDITFQDLGEYRLKDLERQERIY